ncbi:hypothetical protein [Streptomyces carpinensis]|uniref:Uncharacterized protein n=1 Tax=Streptomyces carpinensis TaxID=66369 RepID=A0ABV1W2P5_9ACTN|nr:hypothetical protein [Streptomyces carpinensis]
MAARNIPAGARRRDRPRHGGDALGSGVRGLFPAGDKARWISGHILTVEGGGMGRPPR